LPRSPTTPAITGCARFDGDAPGASLAQPISELGDQAGYDGYAPISVPKATAYVRIAVGVADYLGAEKKLAEDALPRM
jgi:hypothetical protein